MKPDYKPMLEETKRDLRSAKIERDLALHRADEAEKRIASLRQAVAALSQLCGEPFNDQDEFGLTDAIRLALKTVGGPLTALEMKTKLQQLGYDTSSENILPNIHTILKRLVLKGELDDSCLKEGNKTGYRWIDERLRMTPPPGLDTSAELTVPKVTMQLK
jgi:hypothetical protein